jgi:Peptidase family M48
MCDAAPQAQPTANSPSGSACANEDEVAMVIAHEIGHQAADHVAAGQRQRCEDFAVFPAFPTESLVALRDPTPYRLS